MWLLAVIFLAVAELSVQKAWYFNVNFQDVNYAVGYGITFDFFALLAFIVGIILWIRSRSAKK